MPPPYPHPHPYPYPYPHPPPSPSSLLVMPEGTTTTTSPFSSTASLLPHAPPPSRRLPKAPVFILPSLPPPHHHPTRASKHEQHPPLSFLSEPRPPAAPTPLAPPRSLHSNSSSSPPTTLPPHQTPTLYQYDDDYPSIGASDSTYFATGHHSPPATVRASDAARRDRESCAIIAGSVDDDDVGRASFGGSMRGSFASGLRRRVSWCQSREERIRARMKKGGVEDSVLREFGHTRRTAQQQPVAIAAALVVEMEKVHAPQHKTATPPGKQNTHTPQRWYAAFVPRWVAARLQKSPDATQEPANTRGEPPNVAEDARIDVDDVQFISILAYDDFMHSPNRPSSVAKVFSRMRRS